MNRNHFVFAALILVTMMAVSVIGQTMPGTTPARPAATPTPTPTPKPAATPVASNLPVPDSRIALIDTSMFADEKNGIFLYVDAAKKIEIEFRPQTNDAQNLQNRLDALATEITKLRQSAAVDQKTIQAKQAEGERLQQELNTKKQRLDEDVSKRYQQVISPISSQIGAAMDQFARQRGITMTLDLSKLLPAILTAMPSTDLTQAFIDEFNRKNPRPAVVPRP
jgi:Skp family chaperone for outer membrane proteins